MDILFCPHCKIGIEIESINCAIFRCGIYKDSGLQINPHLPKAECEKIKDEIWGCARPFEYSNGVLKECDYK